MNIRAIKKWLVILVITSISFLWFSCEAPTLVENPPPFIEFIEAPIENDSLDVDFTYFQWKGSNTEYKFNYTLYYKDELNITIPYYSNNQWGKTDEEFFRNLDEGTYIMRVRGESFGIKDSVDREFIIDAIRGESVSFFRNENIIEVGDTTDLYVWMEDVIDVKAFRAVIRFNSSLLNLVKLEKGPLVERENFNQVILPNDYTIDSSDVIRNVNLTGIINVSSGFLTESASNPRKSLAGSGNILKITLTAIARGEGNVEYTLIEFYDQNNIKYQPDVVKNSVFIVN